MRTERALSGLKNYPNRRRPIFSGKKIRGNDPGMGSI